MAKKTHTDEMPSPRVMVDPVAESGRATWAVDTIPQASGSAVFDYGPPRDPDPSEDELLN
jgi:hypothetical protein